MNLDDLPEGMTPAQVVEAYEQAWREGSFLAFLELTTPALWHDLGLRDREAFAEAAADYLESSAGLTTVVTGVEVVGDRAVVETTETSADGTDHLVEKVEHRLVRDGADGWLIDAIESVDA
ncbi:hypothetical protein [Demequina sp. NBRC 110056]|uniref:hypothetical protein n=1 Tax=Demequina sp. NBRC 110056 TaxID=1570345 RepID=UPI000A0793C2|nr:hypothetical protein [Demequina sp. NBRC 110056]